MLAWSAPNVTLEVSALTLPAPVSHPHATNRGIRSLPHSLPHYGHANGPINSLGERRRGGPLPPRISHLSRYGPQTTPNLEARRRQSPRSDTSNQPSRNWKPGPPRQPRQPPQLSSFLLRRHSHRHHPTPTPPSLLSSFLDPLGLFSSPQHPRRRSWGREDDSGSYQKTTTTTTTEAPPPSVVYFPDGDQGECGDFSSSQGFDTYSFLGFLLGVVNIVGQVANNVNNNLNSNNNNNNNNNNNLDNINAANSNSNQNNMNTVTIPPGMGGRRRRRKRQLETNEDQKGQTKPRDDKQKSREEEEREWREARMDQEDVIASSVAVPFLRAYWLLAHLSGDKEKCTLRVVCEANFLATVAHNQVRGDNEGLIQVFAEVFTEALAMWSPLPAPAPTTTPAATGGGTAETSSIISQFALAGVYGREADEERDCSSLAPRCSSSTWEKLKKQEEEDLNLDMNFLKKTEGQDTQEDASEHIRNTMEDFAELGLLDLSAILDSGRIFS